MISATKLNSFMLLGKNTKSIINELSDNHKRVLAIECIFNNEFNSPQMSQSDDFDAQLVIARILKQYIDSLCVVQKKTATRVQLSGLELELLNAFSYDEKVTWAMEITFHGFGDEDLVFSNDNEYNDNVDEEDTFPIILYKVNEFNKGIKRLLNKEDTQSYKVISDNSLGYQDLLREYPFWRIARLQETQACIIQHLALTVPSTERSLVMRDARSIFDRYFCSQLQTAFASQREQEALTRVPLEKNRMFHPLSLINPTDLSPEKEKIYRL